MMDDINQLKQQQLSMINAPIDEEQNRIDKARQWLKIISQIESSGGKNTNHPEIESGIHAGDSAIGKYGLMPNTVEESLNRMDDPEDFGKYRNLASDKMKELLEKNPQDEQRIAEFNAERLLDRMGGDEEKAAYGWFQGHNLTPDEVEKRKYKEHDYVNKFNKFKEMFDNEQ